MKSLVCAGVMSLAFLQAQAWNSVGHRAVAEVAWRQLSDAEKRGATDLLKQHPHYEEILIAEVPSGVDTNEWAFLTAAVWPDLVRPSKSGQPARPEFITKYNVHPHGIELPFLAQGETDQQLIKNFPKAKSDLRNVMSDSIATLKNPASSAHDRAVSLGWVLHLMGDSHQPLHTATMVTSTKPKGHSLGGQLMVRDQAGQETSMHTFWDYLPGPDASYAGVAELANELMARPELQAGAVDQFMKNKTVKSWVQESYDTAVAFAYSPGHVRFVDQQDLRSGKTKKSDIPAVTADYLRESRDVAKGRLALAARRLTEILKSTW